eukprot:scaffold843_cov327-Prasinococcus_capsulatus_cf.AAC.11
MHARQPSGQRGHGAELVRNRADGSDAAYHEGHRVADAIGVEVIGQVVYRIHARDDQLAVAAAQAHVCRILARLSSDVSTLQARPTLSAGKGQAPRARQCEEALTDTRPPDSPMPTTRTRLPLNSAADLYDLECSSSP